MDTDGHGFLAVSHGGLNRCENEDENEVRPAKPLKRLHLSHRSPNTPLKQGVNERAGRRRIKITIRITIKIRRRR
jgi:hypothetical protein